MTCCPPRRHATRKGTCLQQRMPARHARHASHAYIRLDPRAGVRPAACALPWAAPPCIGTARPCPPCRETAHTIAAAAAAAAAACTLRVHTPMQHAPMHPHPLTAGTFMRAENMHHSKRVRRCTACMRRSRVVIAACVPSVYTHTAMHQTVAHPLYVGTQITSANRFSNHDDERGPRVCHDASP
jgi:hypothetical protein